MDHAHFTIGIFLAGAQAVSIRLTCALMASYAVLKQRQVFNHRPPPTAKFIFWLTWSQAKPPTGSPHPCFIGNLYQSIAEQNRPLRSRDCGQKFTPVAITTS